jgi:hypothetical protein
VEEVMTENALTTLAITGVGVPPYSARGLHQTVQPIAGAAQLKRTVNAELIDVSDVLFRKYASQISGSDQDPPAIDGIWPGLQVVVDCVFELSYAVGGSPSRSVVAGSSRTEAGFTFYRPQLTMLITDFNVNRDEWGNATSWTMNLEEV